MTLNNPFIENKGDTLDSDKLSNRYGRTYKVSPIFSFKNSTTILTTAEYLFDFESEQPRTLKYLPFNLTRISNNTNEDIEVYVNQNRDKVIFIPSGITTTVPSDVAPSVSSILVKNVGSGTIAINGIRIFVQRDKVTVDQIVKRAHSTIFEKAVNFADKFFGGELI